MAALDDMMQAPRAMDFFLARQPILRRDQTLAGYELLFRSTEAGPANVTDDLSATASVIAHVSELGISNVIGSLSGFINVNAKILMSDIVRFLPKQKVVLEILETVRVTDELLDRIAALAKDGYRFALDDVVTKSENVDRLLPLAEIVKVDIADMADPTLTQLAQDIQAAGKKALAEKVETTAQFQRCLDLGFEYFQGYYFAQPSVLTGKRLSVSQLAIVQLLEQVVSGAPPAEVERRIKQDASLSYALLRLVNTPVAGAEQRIYTIGQALSVLGRRRFHRWLQILLYAGPGAPEAASPLLHLATTRGKLLELMAERIRPDDRSVADVGFTVGILSLTDALFGLPMSEIVDHVAISGDVRDALLHRAGIYGDLLKLAECIEQVEGSCSQATELLGKLGLSSEEFKELELTAFQWSDTVANSAA